MPDVFGLPSLSYWQAVGILVMAKLLFGNFEGKGHKKHSKKPRKHFRERMNDSCKSSIEKYECGVQAVCDLQHIVSSADGVLGSRFMGGGFGGCVVGFIRPSHAAAAVEAIKDAYQKLHPQVANHTAVYLARADDGVRFI